MDKQKAQAASTLDRLARQVAVEKQERAEKCKAFKVCTCDLFEKMFVLTTVVCTCSACSERHACIRPLGKDDLAASSRSARVGSESMQQRGQQRCQALRGHLAENARSILPYLANITFVVWHRAKRISSVRRSEDFSFVK